MHFNKQALALCAILLVHFPLVTGYYFGLTNPWNWFGYKWHSGKFFFTQFLAQFLTKMDNVVFNFYLKLNQMQMQPLLILVFLK